MKRDWDVVRTILLRLEASETPNTYLNAKNVAEYPEQVVAYHMRLLKEAGYIEAMIQESRTGSGVISAALAKTLTSAGHELLDTIRNDTVWGKVKDTFASKGLEMTFEMVVMVGKKIMETLLT